MKKYFPIIITIAVVILIILVIYWFTAGKKKVKGGMVLGYKFYRWSDSEGNDIKYIPELAGNIKGLKKECDATPECSGFNTAGYFKNKIWTPAEFKKYSGFPDWSGLYVKK